MIDNSVPGKEPTGRRARVNRHPAVRAAALLTAAVSLAGVSTAAATGAFANEVPTVALAATHAANHQLPKTYTLAGSSATIFPESVAVDQQNGWFYVSSSGEGTIYRGRLDQPRVEPFLPGGVDGRVMTAGIKIKGHLLYAAGSLTGNIWVYDLRTGALVRRFETGTGGVINDIAIGDNGDFWVTDTLRPVLWHIRAAQVAAGRGDTVQLTPSHDAVDLTNRIPYPPGTPSSNGIVSVDGGRVLLIVQNTTGVLYRLDTHTGAITEVDTHGYLLINGDGLALAGRILYAIRNIDQLLVTLQVSRDARSAQLVTERSNEDFKLPTAVAVVGNRLLIVNSQLDKYLAGTPAFPPFTLTAVDR